MSLRHVAKTVAISGAALACSGGVMFGILASPAGASTLTSPDGNTALKTTGTTAITPGTPYSSGQKINVVVAPNSVISAAGLIAAGYTGSLTGNYYVAMCTDPNGDTADLPTGPSNCEFSTYNHSILRSSTSSGGFTLSNYPIFDLPDTNIGTPTMTGSCDVAPNTCVLGIFVSNPGVGAAFSAPHLFSAPFQVTTANNVVADDGAQPGDGTPEVPLAIGLPLAAAAVLGGTIIVNRRRQRTA